MNYLDSLKSMGDVKIFQAVFDEIKKKSSSGVSYLYLENKYPDFRELQIYIKIYKENLWRNQKYTGVISEKFKLKTHISPLIFIDFINKNKGKNYNIFFINPFPQYKYWYFNAWDQGEIMHPGLMEVSQDILSKIGVDLTINRRIRHNQNNLCFCNYWVGDQDFWQQYVGKVLLPIYEYMVGGKSNNFKDRILNKTNHTTPSTLFPFFIERLFTTYVEKHKKLKLMPFKFSKKEINVF